MKLRHLLFFIILFIGCTSSEIEDSAELASDSQRNWCYGVINDIRFDSLIGNPELVNLVNQLGTAYRLYVNETQTEIVRSHEILQKQLTDKTPEGMRICKIWADMVGVN